MDIKKHDATPKMKTLSESVNESIEKGYDENFKVTARGLSTEDGSTIYAAKDISISDFFRFEGYSNPEDNCILYLIDTHDGRKGLLIDAYGVDADVKISEFIRS